MLRGDGTELAPIILIVISFLLLDKWVTIILFALMEGGELVEKMIFLQLS